MRLRAAFVLSSVLAPLLAWGQGVWIPEVIWSSTQYVGAKSVPGQDQLVAQRPSDLSLVLLDFANGSVLKNLGPCANVQGRNTLNVTANYAVVRYGLGNLSTAYRLSDGAATVVATTGAIAVLNPQEDKVLVMTDKVRVYSFPDITLLHTLQSYQPLDATWSSDGNYVAMVTNHFIGQFNSSYWIFNANTGALVRHDNPTFNLKNIQGLPQGNMGLLSIRGNLQDFVTGGLFSRAVGENAAGPNVYFSSARYIDHFPRYCYSYSKMQVWCDYYRSGIMGGVHLVNGAYDYASSSYYRPLKLTGASLGFAMSNDASRIILNSSGGVMQVVSNPHFDWEYLFATAFTAHQGKVTGGNVGYLEFSDQDYLSLKPQPALYSGGPNVAVEFETFAKLLTVSDLRVGVCHRENTIRAKGRIDLFDWQAKSWQLGPTFNTSGTLTTHEIDPENPSRFIQQGTGKLRCRFSILQLFEGGNWTSDIDEVRFDLRR